MTILLEGAGPQATTSMPADPDVALRADARIYYSFNVDGTDDTGHGNTLTPHGSVLPAIAAGKVSNASQSNPTDSQAVNVQYWTADDSADSRTSASFTWSFWVRLIDHLNFPQTIIIKFDSDGSEYDMDYVDSSNHLSFYLYNGLTYNSVYLEADVSISLNTWYFVQCMYDDSTSAASIRVNNGTPVTDLLVGGLSVRDGTLYIGAAVFGGDPANPTFALIDEVGKWNRVLTTPESDYLYNSGAGRALFP